MNTNKMPHSEKLAFGVKTLTEKTVTKNMKSKMTFMKNRELKMN